MSEHILCDSCRRVIYEDREYKHRTRLEVRVLDTRYMRGTAEPVVFRLDLCRDCDLKVARLLAPALPHLAFAIEPNATVPLETD